MYKHILLPYDGSPLSDKALAEGIALAKGTGAKLTLLYVFTPHHLRIGGGRAVPGLKQLEKQYHDELKSKAVAMLETAQKRAASASVTCSSLIEEGTDAHEVIIARATRLKCDLILMASHGRKGLEGVLVGSETMKVLTHSNIPVLVVR